VPPFISRILLLKKKKFEREVGERLLVHGSVQEILVKYEKIGATLLSKLTFPAPEASITTKELIIRSGLKVRIYTPAGYKGDKPVCVFYHGGGWAMGDLDGEDIQVRIACRDAGVVIVSVDYRLAPQYPYPAPLEDCVFAYNWALENGEMLRTTPGLAAVYGTSAGANLALATALKIVDDGKGDSLVGVVAVVPVTVAPACVPEKLRSSYTSYEEHAEHTINTKSAMEGFFGKLDTMDYRHNTDPRCRCIWSRWKRSLRLTPAAQKVKGPPESLPRSVGTGHIERRWKIAEECFGESWVCHASTVLGSGSHR
jgi:acetyl esterase/lipase